MERRQQESVRNRQRREHGDELLGIDGLGQVGAVAGISGLPAVFFAVVRREGDCGRLGQLLFAFECADPVEQSVTIEVG